MQDAWHDAFTHFDSTRKHKYACDNIQRRRNNDNKQWNCKLNEMNGNWLGSNDCEPTDNYDTHTTQIYPAAMRFRYPISIATKSIRWAHDSTNTMQLLWSATILPIRWHPQWQPSRWRCANQSRKMSPTKPFYCNCLLLDWMHCNFALFQQQRGSMCDCLQVANDCWQPTTHYVGGNFEVNERTIHWNEKKKKTIKLLCVQETVIYICELHTNMTVSGALIRQNCIQMRHLFGGTALSRNAIFLFKFFVIIPELRRIGVVGRNTHISAALSLYLLHCLLFETLERSLLRLWRFHCN